MALAFALFLGSLLFVPIALAADGLVLHGALTLWSALVVAGAVWFLPPGEAAHFGKLIRRVFLAAAFPAVFILIQAMPMPFAGLTHPIWISARDALATSLTGTISISPGDTLLALVRYATAFAILFAATAVTIDRRRAEIVLVVVTIVSVLPVFVLIVHDMGGYYFLGEVGSAARASISGLIVLGLLLSAATVIYLFERYETRRTREDFAGKWFAFTLTLSVAAFLCCAFALAGFASSGAGFAALSGFGTLAALLSVRRLGLEMRTSLALVVLAIALPLMCIAPAILTGTTGITLRFASNAPPELIALTQRMITDTGWLGSGAGSFKALLPIYQDAANLLQSPVAPTAAAEALIGLGRPAFWLVIALAAVVTFGLLHGALMRGRDSFFAIAAVSCTVAMAAKAFSDASLLSTAPLVILMTVFGLGLAQSVSRTARATG